MAGTRGVAAAHARTHTHAVCKRKHTCNGPVVLRSAQGLADMQKPAEMISPNMTGGAAGCAGCPGAASVALLTCCMHPCMPKMPSALHAVCPVLPDDSWW